MGRFKIITADNESFITISTYSFYVYCSRSNALGGCIVSSDDKTFYVPMSRIKVIEDLDNDCNSDLDKLDNFSRPKKISEVKMSISCYNGSTECNITNSGDSYTAKEFYKTISRLNVQHRLKIIVSVPDSDKEKVHSFLRECNIKPNRWYKAGVLSDQFSGM